VDQDFRISQLKVIEHEMKNHFHYGITDMRNHIKPLLAARAFESDNLRQRAFEHKIESFYEETN
jgi:hypothetical protein